MLAPTGSPLNRPANGRTFTLLALLRPLLLAVLFAARPAPSHADPLNLAQNRPATASSSESSVFPAASAVDGNTGTRWASAASDPQWIYVDLGSTQSIG